MTPIQGGACGPSQIDEESAAARQDHRDAEEELPTQPSQYFTHIQGGHRSLPFGRKCEEEKKEGENVIEKKKKSKD